MTFSRRRTPIEVLCDTDGSEVGAPFEAAMLDSFKEI
jgi:hypothetical protein